MTEGKQSIDWQSAKNFLSGERQLGAIIHSAPEMRSTQDEAKKSARAGAPCGTVFVADFQTSGRGRRDRIWNSAPGIDLAFSVVLRPDIESRHVHTLNLAAAMAVKTALDGFFADKKDLVKIKWPNDVMANGKKICGILCECSISDGKPDYAVLGIGVNVSGTHGPDATSVLMETGRRPRLPRLLGEILTELGHFSKLAETEDGRAELVEIYKINCATLGRKVKIITDDGVFAGVPAGIAIDGALLLTDGGKISAFHAADVVHVRAENHL
ncbi:MAG: biotin--[acetyl-CoA-carboxylase] ligase [Synergistaceae bacterium]|jgi:BirA family biotin operon repressor/biotin-[acetyl-CoA-carboxylase] ligase|nr:biotin--[acetyl-CoA-carboxylase] ligase [Synergistaceae bacterium]